MLSAAEALALVIGGRDGAHPVWPPLLSRRRGIREKPLEARRAAVMPRHGHKRAAVSLLRTSWVSVAERSISWSWLGLVNAV